MNGMRLEILVRIKLLSLSSRGLFFTAYLSLLFLLGDAVSAQQLNFRPGQHYIHSTSLQEYEPCIQAMVVRSFHICPVESDEVLPELLEIVEGSVNASCIYNNFERAVNSMMMMDLPYCNSTYFLYVHAEPSFVTESIISLEIHREYYPFDSLKRAEMEKAGYIESFPFAYIAREYPKKSVTPPLFWQELIGESDVEIETDWSEISMEKLPFDAEPENAKHISWVHDYRRGQTVDPTALFGEEIREVVYTHMLQLNEPERSFNIHQYKPELKRHWDWGLSEEGLLIYYGEEGEFRHPFKTLIPKEKLPVWPF